MTEARLPESAALDTNSTSDAGTADKTGKKRKKVRSVWISFVGRIVAQFVGSAATIVLGLMLLQKYQPSKGHSADARAQAAADSRVVRTEVRAADDMSVAVLPLLNLSSNPAQQYVADSMTEILTADLAQIPGLRVLSRTSATNVDIQKRSVPDIAAALGVRYVLEGSVAQADGKVRITAQLIDAQRDEHIWARRYDRTARNILDIQDEIAAAIVHDLATAVVNADDGVAVQTSVSR